MFTRRLSTSITLSSIRRALVHNASCVGGSSPGEAQLMVRRRLGAAINAEQNPIPPSSLSFRVAIMALLLMCPSNANNARSHLNCTQEDVKWFQDKGRYKQPFTF